MKLTSSFLVLLLGAAVFVAGCRTPPRVSDVVISVTGFRPATGDQPRNHAIMTLNASNEGVNAIAFSSATHALYLNGSYVGKAVSNVALGLPATASQSCDVTLVVENPDVVRQALAGPLAAYRLKSVLEYNEGEDKYQINGGGEGHVDVRGLAAAVR